MQRTDTPIYGEINGFKHGEILTAYDKKTGEFTYTDQKTDTNAINSTNYTGIEGAVYALYAREDIVNDNGEVCGTQMVKQSPQPPLAKMVDFTLPMISGMLQ